MGVSNLGYYNDRYKGGLSDQQCESLEQLISLKETGGKVDCLTNSIMSLTDEEVEELITDYDAFGTIPNKKEYKKGALLDYQTISVACMYYAGNCILGDSVGMGKTVEISALLNILRKEKENKGGTFRHLILTEKKIAEQVRREVIRFTGEYNHLIPSADAKCLNNFIQYNSPEYDLDFSIVGTHALLKSSSFVSWLKMYKDIHKSSTFDILIVDESSILGNTSTETVKSFKVLKQYFKRIVFLNATPFEHNLNIFYTQLDLLDNKFLPTKANFQKEYVVMSYKYGYPKPTNKYRRAGSFKKMVGYRYFASTRRENGADMQGCSGGIIVSPLSKVQKELLKLTSIPKFVYDCPNSLDSSIEFNEENVPKLESLSNLLKNECADAETLLLYVHYKEAQAYISNWLDSQGITNMILNGDTSHEDSLAIINGFKNGSFRVLITNVQKGLNFGNCNYCIFYSVASNPSTMVQFEGRMTRSFDIYNKHVYILCSEGKEYRSIRDVLKERAKAMTELTTVDYSVVLSVLLGGKYW